MSDREIDELQRELEQLTIEFNKRASKINDRLELIRLQQAKQEGQRIDINRVGEVDREVFENDNKTIRIGNIVEITNPYKGKKGLQGSVVKINRTGDRCILKTSTGETYIRAPWNLKKL